MDFRKSFSKPFKKLKDKLLRGSHKRDGRSGGEDSRRGSEVDVKEGEASHRNTFLHSEVSIKGAAKSGPSREESDVNGKKAALINADPPTSAPSIIGEPNSM